MAFGDEQEEAGPYILWRHDVDLELPAAISMAEVEAEEGIRSTYFLMTRSWFYNLFSWEGVEAVQRLRELGHSVGLHCDIHLSRDSIIDVPAVEKRVEEEFELVDSAFPGVFCRVVSFHNPPVSVLRREFAGFYSAYQAKFFSDIKYLSDSNRVWRDGEPEMWFDAERHPWLSILLHPVIWAYPGETMPQGMKAYLDRQRERACTMLIADDVHI